MTAPGPAPARARRSGAVVERGRVTLTIGLAVLAGVATTPSCSSVDLGDSPADVNACRPSQAFFVAQIWPNYLMKSYGGKTCGDASCHGSSNRVLRVVAPTSTPTPSLPLLAGSDWDVLYRSAADQVNCSDIAASELYTKPTNLHDHQGGKLFEPNGPELQLLSAWVAGP